jgi:hypothetical protein
VQKGTLWYDTTGVSGTTGVVIWTGSAWAGVGGGGGTVTGVAGTAPIVSSGGSAPAISITPATAGAAGSMSAADKAKLDGAATIVSAVTGTLPITVATGTSTPLIGINAATTALPGSVQLADAAASQAGTSATLVSTPAFTVSKDAATMTGAAILSSGTTAQRPATPVSGMARVNTDTVPQLEAYTNGAWNPIGVITSNLTLNVATTGNDTTGLGTVAAPWATPQKAMAYLSNYQIADGVTVTVSVADGTYTFTTPLVLNHPNGNQITINGGSTSGARPTTTLTGGNAVGNTGATLAANDLLLNAYYNTKWQFNGCHGLVCVVGGGVTVDKVLIRGNASAGFVGVLAGNYSGSTVYASSGSINLGGTVAVHNFGTNGVCTFFGGSVSASGVTSTNNGFHGLLTNYGGSILANNAVTNNNGQNGVITQNGGSVQSTGVVARYNGQNGIFTAFGGSINAASATASSNGGNGIYTAYAGSIEAAGATASNNTQSGIAISYGGIINAQNATALTNTLTNVLCVGTGLIYFTGGNAAGILSPAANTIGNGNSYIVV